MLTIEAVEKVATLTDHASKKRTRYEIRPFVCKLKNRKGSQGGRALLKYGRRSVLIGSLKVSFHWPKSERPDWSSFNTARGVWGTFCVEFHRVDTLGFPPIFDLDGRS